MPTDLRLKTSQSHVGVHFLSGSRPARAPSSAYLQLFSGVFSSLIIVSLFFTGLPSSLLHVSGSPWWHWTFYSPSNDQQHGLPLAAIPRRLDTFQKCSIDQLHNNGLDFLKTAQRLSIDEFATRRNRLAQALFRDGLDAFLVEPGYTFSYYANVTQTDWEVWEPEERPFLMMIRPLVSGRRKVSGEFEERVISAQTTFLVPAFEAERARLLDMPFSEPLDLITYEEHWNAYSTLLEGAGFMKIDETISADQIPPPPKVMVDEEMRDFISRGLANNGFQVHGLGGEVEAVRQIKSSAEIGILRAVNTGTVEALRAMRSCTTPGLREADVAMVLDNTMRSAGLDPFFDIVLFDADAANPHGGTSGTARLAPETMVLIDVGAHLYGYSSDICRSFFPPFNSSSPTGTTFSPSIKRKIRIWNVVFEAQTAAIEALQVGETAAAVDLAARNVINTAGYEGTFTHRVGHGIGIKAHETPYLHQGNVNTTLRPWMTFTAEPGIYLVDEFGVRHEDVLLIRPDGLPDVLSGTRARGPWEP